MVPHPLEILGIIVDRPTRGIINALGRPGTGIACRPIKALSYDLWQSCGGYIGPKVTTPTVLAGFGALASWCITFLRSSQKIPPTSALGFALACHCVSACAGAVVVGWTPSRHDVRAPAFGLLLAEASGCRCGDRVRIVSGRFVLDAAVD